MADIETNVRSLLGELAAGNPCGEKVVLVAATKTRSADEIARAVRAGVTAVGENRVQEFVEKFDAVRALPAERHFIGHLQTNKVKYLIGKVDLIHSVSSLPLAEEIAARSERAGLVTGVLAQVNIGREETKSGFDPDEAEEAARAIAALRGVELRGLMAMFPAGAAEDELLSLGKRMRALYDRLRLDFPLSVLSMGMSADYRTAIRCGSNAVRIGSGIFGARAPQGENANV